MLATALAALTLLAPPTHLAEGHGEDADAAWSQAMEAAQSKLVALLPERLAPHAPLDPALLRRTGAVAPEGTPQPSVEVQGRKLVVARLRVTVTPEYLAEAGRAEKAAASRERQATAGKVLAGILVALLVYCGYLRLEDWTRGYATRWLQAASAALLALAGLALWLLP
jgi:hypothetical protein